MWLYLLLLKLWVRLRLTPAVIVTIRLRKENWRSWQEGKVGLCFRWFWSWKAVIIGVLKCIYYNRPTLKLPYNTQFNLTIIKFNEVYYNSNGFLLWFQSSNRFYLWYFSFYGDSKRCQVYFADDCIYDSITINLSVL